MKLEWGIIKAVKPVGTMHRCCIDLAEELREGEGMLVGQFSRTFFLVAAETLKTEFTDPRVFRVNAGAVSAYVICPGRKTKYLCELRAGDKVMVVDKEGNEREVTVARNKIEKRPALLVQAICEKLKDATGFYDALNRKAQEITVFLQQAETIRVFAEQGPMRVDKLRPGDKILVYIQESVGRHFGMEVDETIIEV